MIRAEVCSQCHPFYTGKQKILDTGGRVGAFEARFGKKPTAEQVARAAAPVPWHPRAWRRPAPPSCRAPGVVLAGTREPASTRGPVTPVFEAIDDLLAEHAELETQLADPAVHADQDAGPQARQALRRARPRSSRPTGVPERRRRRRGRARAGRRGPDLRRRDRRRCRSGAASCEERLQQLLIPRDPNDDKDVILEIKAGEGGEESALFAGDLLRMYLRYAERRGWKTEILDATESDLGGYKDVPVAVKPGGNAASPARASGRG